MRLLTIAVIGLLAGCGNGKKATTPTTGSGSGSDGALPDVVAQTLLGWGQHPEPGNKLELFLEVTDQTGRTQSYPLGESDRPCSPGKGKDDIVTTLQCVVANTGAEYRAVYRGNQIIVLRRPVDPSDDPADIELSFREVQRVDVPVGSRVSAAE